MRNVRLITKLDIKFPNLVKTIQLEGLRKLGNPNEFAIKYYNQGVDEIIYEDIVASLYDRNNIFDILQKTVQNVFIPVTVGGGLRSIQDVEKALRFGADKVSINSAAIKNPKIITEISRNFGGQCLVINIQCKKTNNSYEAYYDGGRERSYLDSLEWAKKAQDLGAGELLITSVDFEGTTKGFDYELIEKITNHVEIPVIASGGMGKFEHIKKLYEQSKPDAICMSHVLHYNLYRIDDLRQECIKNNIPVRKKLL